MVTFGTGGWRAEIGKDFCEGNLRLIGQALSRRILREKNAEIPVVIGYDHRFLSDRAAEWLAEVLCGNGLPVWFLHRSAPTPLIMHIVKTKQLCYGLEITASHNPACYNGVKLIVKEGRDAPVAVTADLEAEIAKLAECDIETLPFRQAVKMGLIRVLEHPFNDFLDDVLALLDLRAMREQGPRILLDPMHGPAAYPLLAVFYTARCTVDQINSNKDAYFGGKMPAPCETTLHTLAQRVVEGGYDLGIGVDGDGDRLGIIDPGGTYISPNDILVLLYYYLHEYKKWSGPAVRNTQTTHLLDRVAEGLGECCFEVPVGFKYISAKMDETDALLGGESSGGLTVRGHIHGKDSVYAAALFVEMLCKTKKTPRQLLREIKRKYGDCRFLSVGLPCTPEERRSAEALLLERRRLPDFGEPSLSVSYSDGCTVCFTDGSFVSCRFSGTEPLLRIAAEARQTRRAKAYIEAWRHFLNV